jgi:hypothetical protein
MIQPLISGYMFWFSMAGAGGGEADFWRSVKTV